MIWLISPDTWDDPHRCLPAFAHRLLLAKSFDPAAALFAGGMFDVRVYSRALTAPEVARLPGGSPSTRSGGRWK